MGAALATVRKTKSEAKVGMRTELSHVTLTGPSAALEQVRLGEADLRAAGRLTGTLEYAVETDALGLGARDARLVVEEKVEER